MAEIIKGESYTIAFTLKSNGVVIDNTMVSGVRIALGNQVAAYPDGTLTYSADDQTWRFPVSQANTYAMAGKETDYQAQVKMGGDIFSSRKRKITVHETMFRKEW